MNLNRKIVRKLGDYNNILYNFQTIIIIVQHYTPNNQIQIYTKLQNCFNKFDV